MVRSAATYTGFNYKRKLPAGCWQPMAGSAELCSLFAPRLVAAGLRLQAAGW